MTLREAAQQALEAMHSFESGTGGIYRGEFAAEITALRAALAEPVQPVAWIYQNANTDTEYLVWKRGEGGRNWRPLYTAPPQRKPLAEEDLRRMWAAYAPIVGGVIDFARAVERAHGIIGGEE